MKKYSIYLLPFAALSLVGSLAVSGAVLLVTVMTASDVVGDLPMKYLERLNLPFLFIALPIVGMLLFAIILSGIFASRKSAQGSVVDLAKRNGAAEQRPQDQLKAA